MSDEILELAVELKNKAKHLSIGHERSWINLEQLIKLCEYIEHNNNLHPAAFIAQEAVNRMNDGIVSNIYVSKDKSPVFNTPIFILK